ncbi:sigma-70 family RNA polymerase sigma factor [soil metagenome]
MYYRYSGRVYSLALRLSADTENAKDITQDTFISVWNNIELFNGESAFYTWLHRITVNNFLMLKRKNKDKETFSLSSEQYNINAIDPSKTFFERIDTERAITKLPEQSRIVFVLHDVEGYKHKEICEMLDIKEGTSKTHLHRARKFLRNELTK